MKLLRLRFQSIFNLELPAFSSSEDPSPASWVVVGLPPVSDTKIGATVAPGNVVGHNAIKADKSSVCLTAAGPFGAVAAFGFAEDGPVISCFGPGCVSANGCVCPTGTRR